MIACGVNHGKPFKVAYAGVTAYFASEKLGATSGGADFLLAKAGSGFSFPVKIEHT